MAGMEYVYAALILHEGKKEIKAENIVNILKAAGLEEVDETVAKAVEAALAKVNIEEIKNKSIAMPVAAAAPTAEVAEVKEEKAEEKKEKKEEKKEEEEEAVAGLASLFG